ncbi:MAG: DUF1566 domain-containing protein [Candidatus Alcyoniella australis]|nr:DUF1566 domain-containing protein [Candidatus Alcyoniella australis]
MKTFVQITLLLLLIVAVLVACDTGDDDDDVTDTDDDDVNDDDDNPTDYEYPLVDTGQDKCYDTDNEIAFPLPGEAFYGQDAQYDGSALDFQDNGDSTVTDLVTGLMWEKTPSSESYSWEGALASCESLTLADYDDWRAPSLKELFSISDFETGWPYVDADVFDLVGNQISKDEQYWSSNHYVGVTVEGQSDAAFGVNHGTGHIKAYPANGTGPIAGNYVRCVRGEEYGVNQFVDNGDGTITDQATGLMWMQNDSGSGVDWENALAYAQTQNEANYLGYTDWRLPNVKELQSIVDYTRSPSAAEAAKVGPAIDPMFSCTAIINEAGDDDYPYFWTSTSAYFNPSDPSYYYAWYVSFGMAVGGSGEDFHGAGAVRFDTKVEGGPAGEGGERYYNYVRLVRGVD